MNSCLYECHVFHRRLAPKAHEFLYRIFLFAIDVDELPSLPGHVPLFHHNEAGLYEFRDTDHFQMVTGSPRENAEAFLRDQGISSRPERILLLTNARFLGYTFNPISIWFCFGPDNQPLAAIAEVGNTFGEIKPYLVPWSDGAFHLRTPKFFYVSPFSDLDLEFDFRFQPPTERLNVAIDDYKGPDRTLISTLTGQRKEFSTSSLIAFTAKYPFITLKTIGLIHWQALRLWLKRLPFHRKEAQPDLQRDLYRPHGKTG